MASQYGVQNYSYQRVQQPENSGLQVASNSPADPRHVDHGPEPYLRGAPAPTKIGDGYTPNRANGESYAPEKGSSPPGSFKAVPQAVIQPDYTYPQRRYTDPDRGKNGTICGLKRKTFFIILVIAIIVILGAIGGGVGGALASRKNITPDPSTPSPGAQNSGSSSSSQASATTSASSKKTPTATKTIVVSPQQTIFRDCPSANGTEYNVQLGTQPFTFLKTCGMAFPALKGNGENFVNEHVSSLNDCIGRCAQFNINNHKTEAGLQQICSTVCWRNNGPNDDWPGNCFGYAVDTTSGQLPVAKKEVICDSAVWIDMPNGKS